MGKAFKLEEDEELPHTRTFTINQPITDNILRELLYRVVPVRIHDRFTDGIRTYVVIQFVNTIDYTRITVVDLTQRRHLEFDIPILYSSTPPPLPVGCKISIKYI